VDLELDFIGAALQGRVAEVAAGAEAEGRREELLDLPERECDEKLLLLLGESKLRVLAFDLFRSPKRANETDVDDECGADGLRGRVIDREDRLARGDRKSVV